eukprot:450755-Pelagomonas_calceolata.AAC.10
MMRACAWLWQSACFGTAAEHVVRSIPGNSPPPASCSFLQQPHSQQQEQFATSRPAHASMSATAAAVQVVWQCKTKKKEGRK